MALGTASLSDLWKYAILTRVRPGGNMQRMTFTRADAATSATYVKHDGTIGTAAANILRIEWVDLDGDGVRETPGISLEGSRTNVVLWNRDLTNAAWTKTTMTAAKDQVGTDGVTNSASSLLATAGNATCLQAITLASSQRAQAVWVKRLVGSGTINMTMDNGVTWTVITLTTAWTRVTIPSQTLANPTVGFRIVTNADKIAVDYVQNENGAFESSAIGTTTVAVTRASDSLTVPFAFGPQDTTVLARIARPVHADAVGDIGLFPSIYELGAGANPQVAGLFGQASRLLDAKQTTSGGSANDNSGAIPAGTPINFCAQFTGFPSAAKNRWDTGSGFGAYSSTLNFGNAYSNQTLKVGGGLYGVVLDLVIARGLYTLQTMLSIP